MCLAIFSLNRLADWPLIIAANRDELHTRPTLSAEPWEGAAHILGDAIWRPAAHGLA